MNTPLSRPLSFQSEKFDYTSTLPEAYNAGNQFYGRDVAQFLAEGLAAAGTAADFLDEDWGWLVQGKLSETSPFHVAIYNLSDHREGGRPGANQWGVWIRAYERKKMLGLIPRTTEVAVPASLLDAVHKVFAKDGITLSAWDEDAPESSEDN